MQVLIISLIGLAGFDCWRSISGTKLLRVHKAPQAIESIICNCEHWNEIAEIVRPLSIPIEACCANDPTLAFN